VRLITCDGASGVADGFLDLPPAIYRDDPNWIPEDRDAVAARLGPHCPWLSRATVHTLCVPGRVRASLLCTDALEVDGVPTALFGHWESTGDPRADALLMDGVRNLASGAGARRLMGPVSLSTDLLQCLRIGGEPAAIPYLGEPYNPPRYAAALRSLGFTLYRRYVGLDLDVSDARRLAARATAIAPGLAGRGYRIEPLTAGAWLERRGDLRPLANDAFTSKLGFKPLTRAEFDAHFDRGWATRLDTGASLLAIGADGQIAGFVLSAPHYGPLLSQGAGPRVGVRDVAYARHAAILARAGDRATVLTSAAVGHEHRRAGLATALIGESARSALSQGSRRLLIGPMHSDGHGLRVFRAMQGSERWYGIYASAVGGGS
jgi:ribosomal protein S18 acetylase RimI-like enzyme